MSRAGCAQAGLHFKHEMVRHSVSEYVNGIAHTNGIESFWSMFEMGYKSIYHKITFKHFDRYVQEFVHQKNIRGIDTIDTMENIVVSMQGKRFKYRELVG